MVSLILRPISVKRARRCLFGIYYSVYVSADISATSCAGVSGHVYCMLLFSVFCVGGTGTGIQPLMRNEEREVNRTYGSIRCCSLAYICISDGIAAGFRWTELS